MAQAKAGDRVQFNFIGTLADGTVFDTTYESDACDDDSCCDDEGCGCSSEVGPMEVTIGNDEFFPAVEQALVGMAPGEKKTITVAAADACGDYDEDLVFAIPRNEFPGDIEPGEGDDLELTDDDGEAMVVTVVDVTDTDVTVDGNHPLAGEDLTFSLELVAIL